MHFHSLPTQENYSRSGLISVTNCGTLKSGLLKNNTITSFFAIFLFPPEIVRHFNLTLCTINLFQGGNKCHGSGNSSTFRLHCATLKQQNSNNVKNLNSLRAEYNIHDTYIYAKSIFRFFPARSTEFPYDDRLRYRKLPRSYIMTTVFMPIKSLVMAIKTVVMETKWPINA